jgi:hypothetical protein
VKRNILLEIIISMVFCSLFASASVTVGNISSNIQSTYNAGESVQGWINLSFNNQDSTSQFVDDLSNSIGLLNVLKRISGANYSCVPSNCLNDYSSSATGENSKTFQLNGEKILGIKLSGQNVEISKFNIGVSSSALANCNRQLEIDVSDDKSIDWGNKKYISETCVDNLKSLCNNGNFPEWILIGPQTYCELISLPKTPAIEIKANVMKDASATPVFSDGLLLASLYNPNKELVGKCNLSAPSTSGGIISCVINYVVTNESEHYVCISTKEVESSGYKLQARATEPYCGFLGDPATTSNKVKDYNIMVSSKKFDAVGTFYFNETTFEEQNPLGESLIGRLNNYIVNNYNKDCSNGCVIPIKFSGTDQQLVLNNLNVQYSSEGSVGAINNLIYEITKTPAKINSGFLKIDLSLLNFTVSSGNRTLKLYINSQEIAKKNITTLNQGLQVIRAIYPPNVAAGNPTTFSAFASSSASLTGLNFKWDFGDGSDTQTTLINKVRHTYDSVGNYTIEIKVIKNESVVSTSQFKISVESPKEAINSTIINYKKQIKNISSQISLMPTKYQIIINDSINLEEKAAELASIESDYKQKLSSSGTTEDYIKIMEELIGLNLPQKIDSGIVTETKLIDNKDEINIEKIRTMTNENIKTSLTEQYKSAIVAWQLEKVNIKINYRLISVYYEDKREDLISEFNVIVNPIKTVESPVYLIREDEEQNLIFDSTYDVTDLTDSTAITLDLSSGQKTVKFAVEGKQDVFDIPMYLAPKFSELKIGGDVGPFEPGSFWSKFWIGMIILLIVFFAVYIFLQEWYKKNYEKSLFKDKNQLYNLIFFISNAKKQGLNNEQIKTKLKKEGWKGEQITYALKKFEGKRVGMWEIPIFYFRDKKKIRQEIEKRNLRRVVY